MAWISLAKLVLLLAAMASLVQDYRQQGPAAFKPPNSLSWLVLGVVALFALSILWTEVDQSFAWLAWVKHAKLLEIILILQLVRTRQEALAGVAALMLGHFAVLALSYLIAAGVPLPNYMANSHIANVVFAESYIDQGLMTVVFISLAWHLRQVFKLPTWLALMLCTAGLVNVLVLLPGRTAFISAAVVVGVAVMWAIPKRWQLGALIMVPLLVVVTFFASSKVQEGFSKIPLEIQQFTQAQNTETSTGWRLNAWHRSLQAMHDQPLGYGVGSWAIAVKRQQAVNAEMSFGTGNSSNPHQEYLLWGVALGLPGIALLLALLVAAAHLARTSTVSHAALSVLAVVATACLFNSAIYDDLVGDFLCISLGLVLALCRQMPAGPSAHASLRHQTSSSHA